MTSSPGVEGRIKKQRKQPKVPWQMEREVDRISNLPGHLVDNILSRLTLRKAVRTCILSSNWRYKWVNLTSLVFDDHSVTTAQMVKIVDHVLLLHNGVIHQFKLCLVGVCDIDCWILVLSRRSVKKIVLKISNGYSRDYKLSSLLYLCNSLTHLELDGCSVRPFSAFNGFKMLTDLQLSRMKIDECVLENLIYSCPLLERLELTDFEYLTHLKINAPKLTSFAFSGTFNNLTFENTVHLSTVSINFTDAIGDDNITQLSKFFASLPSIQRLMVDGSFLLFLAAKSQPWRLPTPCMQLNYLSLPVNFIDMDECQAALCIFRSSPNLLKLEIHVADPDDQPDPRVVAEKLLEEDYQNCFFSQLRFVKIFYPLGNPIELNFIKFLLANSPKLERMTVDHGFYCTSLKVLKELIRFRRVSANAEIICLHT